MIRTLAERLSPKTPIQKRDTLDEVAALWKTGRDTLSDSGPGQGPLQPYRQHAWVYACVSAIARNVSQVPFVLKHKTADDEQGTENRLPDTDPLVQLFRKPNPMMSRYDLWTATETFLNLGGNCLWVPVPGSGIGGDERGRGGGVAEIWVFGRESFQAVIREKRFVGWKVKWAGGEDEFKPEEVLHFRYFNPYDPIMGMSPVEAARLSVNQDWWANKYNEGFFMNFAEPGVVISFKDKIGPAQRLRVREEWNQRHQGFNRARQTAVLWSEATISELGMTKRDMQFIEQKKWNREEVLAIFRVPPVEVMLVELVSSQVESQRAQRVLFGEEVIAPELAMLEDRIATLFDNMGITDVVGEFDTSEVSILQESLGEKLTQAKDLFALGFTGNEINKKLSLGFDDKPWRDVYWVETTKAPAETLMSGPAPKEPPPATPPPKEPPTPPKEKPAVPAPKPAPAKALEPAPARRGLPPPAPPELVSKMERWVFRIRNLALRRAPIEWNREQVRLAKIIPDEDARALVQAVIAAHGRIDGDREQIKAFHAYLKGRAREIVQLAPPLIPADGGVVPPPATEVKPEVTETMEDAVWRAYVAKIDPIENDMTRAVRAWATNLKGKVLAAVRDRPGDAEPKIDWDEAQADLARRVSPPLAKAIVENGKVSALLPQFTMGNAPETPRPQPATRAMQDRATMALREIAAALSAEERSWNEPVDLVAARAAIEVKVLLTGKLRKVSMSASSLEAKVKFASDRKLSMHTVVADMRGAAPVYYYAPGFGSYQLKDMQRLASVDQLKRRMKR